jgi:hypothetical protein
MTLRPVEYEPLMFVVRNMRQIDRDEVFATGFSMPPDGPMTDDDMMVQQTFDAATRDGCGWIASLNGEPIAAIGMTLLWPGVVSVWMFATDSWPKVALALTRWAKKAIFQIMSDANIHRAQCWSLSGHDTAHRWLRHLGATEECVSPNYGRSGETFHLFGWSKGRDF